MSGSPSRTTAGDTTGSKPSRSNSARRVSASTIGRVLKTLPIPPPPQRHTGITWRGFLHAQAATTLATGFFHVDRAFTRRLYCFFVMEAGSRYAHIPGVTAPPGGPRATRQVRHLLIDLGDRPAGFRFLVRDRAGQCTASTDAVLAGAGIQAVNYPNRRGPGRPPTAAAISKLVIRVATDNPTSGHRCVQGEFVKLGHTIAGSSVWQILHAAGIDPAPRRTGPPPPLSAWFLLAPPRSDSAPAPRTRALARKLQLATLKNYHFF